MKSKYKLYMTFGLMSSMLLGLTSCGTNAKTKSYYIDTNGDLIEVLDNGEQNNIGKWGDDVISSFKSVTISDDGYYVINGIKTNISIGDEYVKGVTNIEVSNNGNYVVNGVETNISATPAYTVSFDTGFSTQIKSQKVKENYKVERPNITRVGYILDGWFCNGEEWRFNSDVVLNDLTLIAKWTAKQYTISFVNEKGNNPSDLNVTYDSQYTLPSVEPIDGYSFGGWFNGSTKYNSGTWKTDSNVILTAKWVAKTYTVTLNPNVGSVSKTSQTVTYGESYTLPVPTNDYGVFNGWILDDELVTDNQGHSLAPWAYTENKTFTVEWDIKLYTASDLSKLHTYPNASFSLMNDIDLSSVFEWIPVGDGAKSFFTGRFEGNGHTISNVKVNTSSISSRNSFGFFGTIAGATIQNVRIKNFSFTSTNINQSYAVGALVGRTVSVYNQESKISNCKVDGSFTIASQSSSKPVYAGGIVGYAYSSLIDSCVNDISISNALYSGGIVGETYMAYITNSHNLSDISASSMAGGIVGKTDTVAVITNSKNKGKISGTNSAGGMIGWGGYYSYIDLCVNIGEISSTTQSTMQGAGGLVGAAYSTEGEDLPEIKVVNSYNLGNVNSYMAGGLAGMTYRTDIQDSYNAGTINGKNYSAGLCGFVAGASAEIRQCLATGSVSGGTVKSTLVGSLSGFSAPDCYHTYNTSSWSRTEGTYYTGSLYGSEIYNNMYWSNTIWDYNNNNFPTLKIESKLNELLNGWA